MNISNNQDWQKDPRLASLEPEKLRFLADFSERMQSLPRDQWLQLLLSLRLEAEQKHIRFTDPETLLLASVLSDNMTPEQRQRAEALRAILQRRT